MKDRIVAFGPSLVDVHACLEDEQYKVCLKRLDAAPGDWVPLESQQDAADVMALVTGGNNIAPIIAAPDRSRVNIAVGSSLLNMLGAMPREYRSRSTLATAHAMNNSVADPLATFFSNTVEALNIYHYRHEIEGSNPVGIILTSPTTTEKTMVTYQGVTTELEPYDLALDNTDLAILDAYELRRGKLAKYLHKLILHGEPSIALSLGNHTILEGSLRTRIRSYLSMGKIAMLCGNELEYKQLFPDVHPDFHTKEGFADHPIRQLVPHALITYGKDGMAAFSGQNFACAESVYTDPGQIVSTAGAGDVAAGTFYSGVLQGNSLQSTLEQAALQSRRALLIRDGLVNLVQSQYAEANLHT